MLVQFPRQGCPQFTLIASLCASNGYRHGFIRGDIVPSERPRYRAVNRIYLIQGSLTEGNNFNSFTDQRLTTCKVSTGGSLEEKLDQNTES